MKIACDICEKVIDADNVKTENWLSKECSDKFWNLFEKGAGKE